MTEAGADSLNVEETAGPERKHRPSGDQDPQGLAEMLYTVEETPAWYLCILLGLQHCITCFGANMTVALVIAPAMCITDNVVISQIIGTIFFTSGLTTLLQTTLGIRLPLVQGAGFSFVIPTYAILSLPQWQCPIFGGSGNDSLSITTPSPGGTTESLLDVMSSTSGVTSSAPPAPSDDSSSVWQSRMNEIQGALILASIFEVLLGFTGLIGILMRYIGPLVIGPVITLVGLSLFPAAADFASKNWYIAILTSFLIILFSQYLRHVSLPCCVLGDNHRCIRSKFRFPIFTLFAVILAIVLAWLLCWILTVTDAVPDDPDGWSYHARTDVKIDVLYDSAWFRFPYPFQWGLPTFSAGAVLGMLAGVFAGAIESIGDYYACARLCGAPPPPVHAVNRGIFVEGLGCIISGMWGSGSGSTTYSENVGAIGITKVGSRRVNQVGAIFLMLFGLFTKFGALFVTIPDPVIGGFFLIMFGMIAAVGVSNLQFVDLNSTRNLCIFGFSVMFGLALPFWISSGDNASSISTGSAVVDQIFIVLLSTNTFIGGLVGFLLDSTVPGTTKERGLTAWRAQMNQPVNSVVPLDSTAPASPPVPPGERAPPEVDIAPPSPSDLSATAAAVAASAAQRSTEHCYDLPFGMKWVRRRKFLKYVPISPTFLQDVANTSVGDSVSLTLLQEAVEAPVAVTTGGDDVIGDNRSDVGVGEMSSNGDLIGITSLNDVPQQ